MSSFEPLVLGTPIAIPSSANLVRDGLGVPVWLPAAVCDTGTRAAQWNISEEEREAAAERQALADAAEAREAELAREYARGIDDGQRIGESAEQARVRGAMLAAEQALHALREGESRWLAAIEENVAAISVAVAQQIIAREVITAPEIVADLVARAVREFGLDQSLSIRVNPNDCEVLHGVARDDEGMSALNAAESERRWVSDARIGPGGCVVEGRERIVDGRVDTGLERLYRRLARINA